MADIMFNVAKGARGDDWTSATIKVLLLQTAEADAGMRDRTTITGVLSGSTEADFTNYVRKTLAGKTRSVDQTNDRVDYTASNPTWTTAGGATNNTLAKLVVYKDVDGTDGNAIPISAHDFVVTTDGSDLTAQFAAAGVWRAS